ADVLDDLRTNADHYKKYYVQYIYVIDSGGKLIGVIRLRDLVMAAGQTTISTIMVAAPLFMHAEAELDALEAFFDTHHFYALPVVDAGNRMIGVVRQTSVEEALGDRSQRSLLRFGGIVTGEE